LLERFGREWIGGVREGCLESVWSVGGCIWLVVVVVVVI
jgi:hypothetical protein